VNRRLIPRLRLTERWSIGIYTGDSPFALRASAEVVNPVLTANDVTDLKATSVADPFMIRLGAWYMFFEVMDAETRRGRIAYAQSDDGLRWRYGSTVLEEPFHLSYPYVFAWDGELYMVPESGDIEAVRLYRADKFPNRWVMSRNILVGEAFRDSSLVRHRDRWWLFTTSRKRNDNLRLYSAERIERRWTEHPQSPVVSSNPHVARSAGRVFECDGRLFRLAQDDSPWYGRQVWAFEITQLTATNYAERLVAQQPVLRRGRSGWNSWGMHHADPHPLGVNQWFACVDGYRRSISVELERR
jgi:hypothetical protein